MTRPRHARVLITRGTLLSVTESSSNRGRSAGEIVLHLLSQITSGRYPVGTRLPGLRSSEYLGAAQQTVFVAMRQLVDMGVVESHARRGYYVAALPQVDVRDGVQSRLDEHDARLRALEEFMRSMGPQAGD